MKVLVTGAKGFVGRNLVWELKNRGFSGIYEYDVDTESSLLGRFTEDCGFVFHLAGVNRTDNDSEFYEGNRDFTRRLIDSLIKNNNRSPVLLTSSIKAGEDSEYGKSKKAGEDELFKYSKEYGVKVLVYRLPNLFGKWCRPNYNSVVATFCHNIANGLPIDIRNAETVIPLVYIDDLLEEFINALRGNETKDGGYCSVPVSYKISLGRLAELLYSFRDSRQSLITPDTADGLTKKLYSTYISYLPKGGLSYPLNVKANERGCFAEFLKNNAGQVSINVTKPGVTKGSHWHHTKTEKFLVVSGESVVRLRNIATDELSEYHVSGKKLEVIDIPAGYAHSLTNIGEEDMIAVIWANEVFDPERSDTYYSEV